MLYEALVAPRGIARGVRAQQLQDVQTHLSELSHHALSIQQRQGAKALQAHVSSILLSQEERALRDLGVQTPLCVLNRHDS